MGACPYNTRKKRPVVFIADKKNLEHGVAESLENLRQTVVPDGTVS